MATKAELIERLEELNARDDAEQASEEVEAVKEAYETIVAHALQAAHAGDDGTPAAETSENAPGLAIESAPLQDEEDKRFKQLLDAYNQRVNEIRRRKVKEEADNMAAKKAIMEELKALIANEENISSAFNRFNELHEKWRSIGPVPAQHYRELQTDYSHLRDEFFYHIRIYKELRDHDLRKNTALKQALVADMQSLALKDNVRELEQMVREYQEKWQQIGPVVREEWEAVRDGFWNATRVVYDKVHEHYRARRAEHEANLAAKQGLIDKVTALFERTAGAGTKEWKLLTEEMLELQNAWKQIGFATKKDNERIWKEFRNACNTFFDAKKQHFDSLKDQFRAARERKQALLDEALVLKESREWKRTADRLKQLQQQWKEAGSAGPRDENKLWSRFREACDAFFQNRKATFAKQDEEQAASALEKEALLAEIEGFQLSGERGRDLGMLKEFSVRWMNTGRVSPRLFDTLNERYRAALDKHYGQLKMEGDERRRVQFQDHVDSLKSAPDGRDRMERESRFVKRRIEELQAEMRQMEQNMGMFNFKSASGEAMRREMEKKIERLAREVERLQGQHRELQKELR
jgi:hypothetical protein